jgi:hypothetical protein
MPNTNITELFTTMAGLKQDFKKDWKETSKKDWKVDWETTDSPEPETPEGPEG